MPSTSLQSCLEREETQEKSPESLDKRSIATVQICLRCGETFTYKKGRKRCPNCQNPMKTRIIILKVP